MVEFLISSGHLPPCPALSLHRPYGLVMTIKISWYLEVVQQSVFLG